MNQQTKLDKQLRDFRKKYYTDKIIRGSLILALLISSMLFVVLLGEGLFGFSAGARTGFVFGLGAIFLGTLGYMVLWPLTQLLSFSNTISDFQIADIVRRHFPNINDKLTNLLQLRNSYGEDNSLAIAAIDQKTAEVAPVPISKAVNLKVNRKYLYLLLIPAVFFLGTYLINGDMLKTSMLHLKNYNTAYTPPPPFDIIINELPSQIVAGQDYKLDVQVEGRTLPKDLFIYMKKNSESQFLDYNLEKLSNTDFTYVLSDIKEDFSFFIGNPERKSDEFEIKVLKRPYIKNFKVTIDYPNYTGLKTESLENNVGDFKAIKGSVVTWTVDPQGEIKDAYFVGNNKQAFKEKESSTSFHVSKKLMEDLDYFISLNSTDDIVNIDTVKYRADVLLDRYPSIYVFSPNSDFLVDLDTRMPLELEIADDFGFTKMTLFYRFTKSGGTSEVSQAYRTFPLEISSKTLLQPRNYDIDLTELGLREGDELEYYIKVWDNDGVSGPKVSTSATFKVIYPTLDAKYEEVSDKQDEVKDDIEKLQKKAQNLKEEYRKIQEKLLEKKQLSFDDKKEIQRMLDEHTEMMNEIEEAQEKFEETKEELEKNDMISPETLEKYEQLNEFLEDLENPELEKMLQELQDKMEELNPEDIKEQMEKMELNDEEIQKSLERTLELLKQLEVQQKIDEIKNKLENLEAKQELLNQKTDETDTKDNEELDKLGDRQEELEKQMDGIQEDLKELEKMKEETSTPDDEGMKNLEKMGEEAEKEMNDAAEKMKESSEQSGEGKKKDAKKAQKSASDSQKKAKKKLSEMSEALGGMQMQMQMQQDQQNLENLRELLENLLTLSFDQEDLRDGVKELKYGDPALKDKSQSQKKLQDDMSMVRDSLESLAKKVFQIQKFVMDESKIITENMKKSQTFFRNKQIPMITYHQQTSMTSINNLANMLSDVMKQMQEQMKNAMAGEGSCPKPGQSGMGMQKLGKQQQQLNQQMQQMMKGAGPGGVDPGKMAQMAAQQEAIRKALKEAHDKIQQEGGKSLGDMGKIMQDMQETEAELMNKQLTKQTLERQKKILTRLLYSDKAVRERDLDDKRESKTAQIDERKSPEELSAEEYKNRLRQELLKSNQLEYSSDFIKLIEEYYKKLEETNE